MREIKYRAWNKSRNELFFVKSIDFINENAVLYYFDENEDGDNELLVVDNPYPDGRSKYHISLDDLILMQYTGLKDKNGNEIYENDICRFITWENKYEIEIPTIDIIEFKNGSFTFEDIALYEWMDEDNRIKLEVIGNKLENPELLK